MSKQQQQQQHHAGIVHHHHTVSAQPVLSSPQRASTIPSDMQSQSTSPQQQQTVTLQRLMSHEEEILRLQQSLSTQEEALLESNKKMVEMLINYSKSYKKEFNKQLKDFNDNEETVRKEASSILKNIVELKKTWRKNVLICLKELVQQQQHGSLNMSMPALGGGPRKQFAEVYLAQSKLLQQEERQIGAKDPMNMGSLVLDSNDVIVKLGECLGRGAFGEVFKGICRGKDVAVKTLKHNFTPNVVEDFFRECYIMRSLAHPSILLFLGACTDPGNYKLVTEIAPHGSLDKLLHSKEKDSDCKQFSLHFARKMKMAREIAEGMNCLHKQTPPLLHLDLKPANILLMEDWTVKIADFGISRLQQSTKKDQTSTTTVSQQMNIGVGGTPLYMPPEMFSLTPIPTPKCDVYAYGMILWEIVTEEIPYKEKHNTLLSLSKAVTANERPQIPPTSVTLSHLIQDAWDGNPDNRPHFSEILDERNNYFNKITGEWISNGQQKIQNLWSQFSSNPQTLVEEVSWNDFQKAFCSMMNVSENEIRKYDRPLDAIKELLQVDARMTVSYAKFERFLKWFSPLQPVSTGRSTFDEVMSLISENWFWGLLSAEDAKKVLEKDNVPVKSFLVRFSENKEGQFVLSMKLRSNNKKDSVQHIRIEQKPNTPIVQHINQIIKQNKLKKPPANRPSAFEALTKQEQTTTVLYMPGSDLTAGRTPWHSPKVIY